MGTRRGGPQWVLIHGYCSNQLHGRLRGTICTDRQCQSESNIVDVEQTGALLKPTLEIGLRLIMEHHRGTERALRLQQNMLQSLEVKPL